ncbi:MAG: CHAT domain-containing protein [Anaerolineae bacterium]|nr:CHAT domain-containing protein [Candidatus Roseilinea sp.]MDW8448924.1 CHAT domain-containing protein [Anaerolineae bacterium]
MPAEDARRIVDVLKDAADRHWRIDPHRSAQLANLIIAIGEARGDTWIRALGTMAKGDAVKFIGSQSEAWDLLEAAACLFEQAGDEVGWGRTWIGRLTVAAQLNRVPEAIRQANIARDIFIRHGERLRQLRIEMALGDLHRELGDHRAAMAYYQTAVTTAAQLGAQGEYELRAIYNNMGVAALQSGQLREALQAFERSLALLTQHGEDAATVICRNNIGVTLARQGHLREALKYLSQRPEHEPVALPLDARTHTEKIECLLALNRFVEARQTCLDSRRELLRVEAHLAAARVTLHLATAEAHLNNLDAAQEALEEAEALFDRSGAAGLVMLTRLRQAQVALIRGDRETALMRAQACADFFRAAQQHHNYAEAVLAQAQTLADAGGLCTARRLAVEAARIARELGLMALRFDAHTVLGQIAEGENRPRRAMMHYAAAAGVVQRVQRELTLTLRPGFMLDKLRPLRALFRLHVRHGELAQAFDVIERARAQAVFDYLSGREHLRWSRADARSQQLIETLARLRESHYDLYTRVHDDFSGATPAERARLRAQLADVEQRMRNITEQLYLNAPAAAMPAGIAPPDLAAIQRNLSDDQLLIAYYDDGTRLHALSLDRARLEHHLLDIDRSQLASLNEQLQRNIGRALAAPDPWTSDQLRVVAERVLQRLHRALIQPWQGRLPGRCRLYIVPYGLLHSMPFNLLYDGARYLVEAYEIAVLPTAGLLTRPAHRAERGATALVYDRQERLPSIYAEVSALTRMFDVRCYIGRDAERSRLRDAPRQILHIAAHGEHRPDDPDFSYIELADGQLFVDDLLQLDLGYELVTLSACETGRMRVAPHDEVMGLNSAFLYAGAGAVLASLWRVGDSDTAALMAHFYRALHQGASKARAIQEAQQVFLRDAPSTHPARWGAFQLIGNPDPLST